MKHAAENPRPLLRHRLQPQQRAGDCDAQPFHLVRELGVPFHEPDRFPTIIIAANPYAGTATASVSTMSGGPVLLDLCVETAARQTQKSGRLLLVAGRLF